MKDTDEELTPDPVDPDVMVIVSVSVFVWLTFYVCDKIIVYSDWAWWTIPALIVWVSFCISVAVKCKVAFDRFINRS